MKNTMLIDNAFKVLLEARRGNRLSAACFDDWADVNKMPLSNSPEYETVKTSEDFYQVCYYHTFGD